MIFPGQSPVAVCIPPLPPRRGVDTRQELIGTSAQLWYLIEEEEGVIWSNNSNFQIFSRSLLPYRNTGQDTIFKNVSYNLPLTSYTSSLSTSFPSTRCPQRRPQVASCSGRMLQASCAGTSRVWPRDQNGPTITVRGVMRPRRTALHEAIRSCVRFTQYTRSPANAWPISYLRGESGRR
jgi:hypothetical protein